MDNFVYDSEGNLTEDKSKNLKISYDWRGMPTEFVRKIGCYDYHGVALCDSTKLEIKYDGSGRRVSKTRLRRDLGANDWAVENVTHYTGIGTEVREAMRRSASPKTIVVVNLPQGLGRYLPEDAEKAAGTAIPLDKDGKPVFMGEATPEFEWYLKNHLGSTMLVYGTQPYNDKYSSYAGGVKAAYDYRAFGEQVDLAMPTDKVTENFTGKEKDDETELNYFGARYLDPMLGMWTSVDPKRQFASPYLYAGNGVNPVNGVDPDGNKFGLDHTGTGLYLMAMTDQNPKVQERLVTLASSPETYKSLPLKENMNGPNFDVKTNTFYYDKSSKMSLIEQFYHEMLGHGYQVETGMFKVNENNSKMISNEVDAYEMQFLAPGGEKGWMYKTYKKSGSQEEFGVELMTNEKTSDVYGYPSYTDDYAE